jgi:serine/threonine protein kinase/tetratricopeptide (TPR) repeat protein
MVSTIVPTPVAEVPTVQAVAPITGHDPAADQAPTKTLDMPVGAIPHIVSEGRTPSVPGYVIEGILGRGGMGVVYKARQLSLKRTVALKMILAGAHAGPDLLARFRMEAEAVAHLQHPNIVQIYEIGDQDGLCYFSLEYVDGGSLAAQLAGGPRPPEDAARYVEVLARTMHYCHQKGIVHRDLKPANVLLTAEGTPKVTDFGLAKQLEGDAGQTRSGAVIGTPSYMAPEQAAGRTRAIGPATDVYALGAILYEMLTGRPPFKAETMVETLEQVRTRDPEPPSRLQPRVPRDLETVCLKALAKEPGRRYHSALAFAQDLERFRAGESILGKRESLSSRTVRKIRRNLVASVSLVLMFVAVVIAAVVASRALSRGRQIATLTQQVESGLRAPQTSAEYLAGMEKLIDDLDRLDPAPAEEARDRLRHTFADALRDSFSHARKPTLGPNDVTEVQAGIDLLAGRDPELARAVKNELKERLGRVQTVQLKPPFDNFGQLFGPGVAKPDGTGLVRAHAGNHVVNSQLRSQGNSELEAVFDSPSWEEATQIGLMLSASPNGDRGYSFLILPAEDEFREGVKSAKTLGESVAKRGQVRVQIVRHRIVQRQVHLPLRAGKPVRMHANHLDDLVSVQVDDRPPLKYHDPFPMSDSEAGVFALIWPGGVRLTSLQARYQTLPAVPSPLQGGDALYAQGRFDGALNLYRAQLEESRDPAIRQEARCKEGLCLLGLKRLDEAAPIFEQVMAEKGERWPAWAACQLWIVRLKQKRATEADALFVTLADRYSAEQMATLISDDVRGSIWEAYYSAGTGQNLLRYYRPENAVGLERFVMVQEYIGSHFGMLNYVRHLLCRAYRLSGQTEKAFRVMDDLVRRDPSIPNSLYEEYFWLLRERKETQRALDEINRHMFAAPGVLQPGRGGLYVERARIFAVLGRWDECEKDLEEVLRHPVGAVDFRTLASACLMRGFLEERRGNAPAAMAVWKRAVYRDWVRAAHPEDVRAVEPSEVFRMTDNVGLLTGLMVGSLTNEFSDAEGDALFVRLTSAVAGDSPIAAFKGLYRPPASTYREMWRSPRGHELARKMAFRELTFAEFVRVPLVLYAYETIRRGMSPDALPEEQDALVWKLSEDSFNALIAGTFTKQHVMKFGLAWSGVSGPLGWKGLESSLDASLRGRIAFVMGRRYASNLKQPEVAAEIFRTARDQAGSDTQLRRLAEAELNRMK